MTASLFALKGSRLPKVLYHYTSMDVLLSIMRCECIWASHVRYLNDHSEVIWLWRKVVSQLLDHGAATRSKRYRDFLDALHDHMLDEPRLDVYVASFSTEGDDLSQWRGYCPRGTGVSIGFDPRALAANFITGQTEGKLIPVLAELRPVVYMGPDAPRQFSVDFDSALRAINDPTEEEIERIDLFWTWFASAAPRCKHYAFRSEREWRLVIRQNRDGDLYRRFRPGQSSLVPFVEARLNLNAKSMPKAPYIIRRVVLGPTPSMELSLEALKSMFISIGHPEVDVVESRIPYRNW